MYQNDRERSKYRHHKTANHEKTRDELKTEDQIRRKRKDKQRQMDKAMKRKSPSGGFDRGGPNKKQKMGGAHSRSKAIYRK